MIGTMMKLGCAGSGARVTREDALEERSPSPSAERCSSRALDGAAHPPRRPGLRRCFFGDGLPRALPVQPALHVAEGTLPRHAEHLHRRHDSRAHADLRHRGVDRLEDLSLDSCGKEGACAPPAFSPRSSSPPRARVARTAAGEAPHHRDGPLPLRLGGRSAAVAGRHARGVHPRHRQRERGGLRHRPLDRAGRRQRAARAPDRGDARLAAALVAGRTAHRVPPRAAARRQAGAAADSHPLPLRRRGLAAHRRAARHLGGGVVAGREADRLHQQRERERPREAAAREGRAENGAGRRRPASRRNGAETAGRDSRRERARERRAHHHPRRLPLRQSGIHRSS